MPRFDRPPSAAAERQRLAGCERAIGLSLLDAHQIARAAEVEVIAENLADLALPHRIAERDEPRVLDFVAIVCLLLDGVLVVLVARGPGRILEHLLDAIGALLVAIEGDLHPAARLHIDVEGVGHDVLAVLELAHLGARGNLQLHAPGFDLHRLHRRDLGFGLDDLLGCFLLVAIFGGLLVAVLGFGVLLVSLLVAIGGGVLLVAASEGENGDQQQGGDETGSHVIGTTDGCGASRRLGLIFEMRTLTHCVVDARDGDLRGAALCFRSRRRHRLAGAGAHRRVHRWGLHRGRQGSRR